MCKSEANFTVPSSNVTPPYFICLFIDFEGKALFEPGICCYFTNWSTSPKPACLCPCRLELLPSPATPRLVRDGDSNSGFLIKNLMQYILIKFFNLTELLPSPPKLPTHSISSSFLLLILIKQNKTKKKIKILVW